MKNGKEVSRELVKEETAAESKAKIIAVGTKQAAVATVSANVSRGNQSSGKEFMYPLQLIRQAATDALATLRPALT